MQEHLNLLVSITEHWELIAHGFGSQGFFGVLGSSITSTHPVNASP
jgi:hypothetical protein